MYKMVENSVIDDLVLDALDMIEYATEVVDDTRNLLKMNEKKSLRTLLINLKRDLILLS